MERKELSDLRALMEEKGIAVCVVPTADPHESEYPGAHFEARKYLSGFTGSAGTLAVSGDWAGLWTDARYFLQAEAQLSGSGITLYKIGEKQVPELAQEIRERLPEGGVLAYDGRTVNRRLGERLREAAGQKNGSVLLTDLPGQIWKHRPPLSAEPVFEMPLSLSGEARSDKIRRIREVMEREGARVHVVTTLDDIAWIMNLRGHDVPCNPVFFSYLVIGLDQIRLFVQKQAVSAAIRESLEEDGVILEAYEDFYGVLPELTAGKTVYLDSRKANEQVFGCLGQGAEVIDRPNPSELMKAVKNETEIANIRLAHRKDAAAVTRFLYWLKKQRERGFAGVTELSAGEKLEAFRREQEHYLEPSFETICACGANGAIVHYTASEETNTALRPEGFLLVDSGGQYMEGTTDITRTIVLGPLTAVQKKHFTAVLKGMLALGNARFLYGCRGVNLDYLAREPLWAMGLDYRHGTGHGVGHLLNVHESPNSFRWKCGAGGADSAVLEPGMVTSDEPGVYLAGQYGIRTENLLLCRKAEENEYGQFLEFEFLTLVPIDLEGIDWTEMEEKDIERLNRYHQKVYETLAPCFSGEELAWLAEATKPFWPEKEKRDGRENYR